MELNLATDSHSVAARFPLDINSPVYDLKSLTRGPLLAIDQMAL